MNYEYYKYHNTIYRIDYNRCILEYYYNNKWWSGRYITESITVLRGHEKDKNEIFLEML